MTDEFWLIYGSFLTALVMSMSIQDYTPAWLVMGVVIFTIPLILRIRRDRI